MAENDGFFTDPKVWLGIISILLSIVIGIGNFFYTLSAQHEQNRRWDKLNIADIALTDVGFLIFQELSEQKARETEWGYKPILFRAAKDRVFSGVVQIPYGLVLVRPVTDKKIEEIPSGNFFFTLSEGISESKRLELKDGQYIIMKRFEIQFNFKNIGRTVARDLQGKIVMIEPKNNEGSILTQPIEMLLDMSFNKTFQFYTSVDSGLPANLKFELYFKYRDIHEEEHEKRIPVTYDSSRNYWEYGR